MPDDKDRHQDLKAGEEDRKLDLITFDWSGTCSDDRYPVYLTNLLIMAGYGERPSLSFDQWLERAGATTVGFLERQGVGFESSEQVREDFERYYSFLCEEGCGPELYDDVPSVLNDFKEEKRTLAVLSAHPTSNLEEEIEQYGLDGLFDYVVGSCDDKTKGLREVSDRLEVDGTPIYVGDTVRDIKSADQADFTAAALTNGYGQRTELAEANPDFLADSLTDLKHQLEAYEAESEA